MIATVERNRCKMRYEKLPPTIVPEHLKLDKKTRKFLLEALESEAKSIPTNRNDSLIQKSTHIWVILTQIYTTKKN
jgi:hypothetical protein